MRISDWSSDVCSSDLGPQFERAIELARQLHPFEQSLKDAQTCIDALKGKGPVFVTGYCYGGSVAWRMAQISPDLAAASAYYGSMVPTQFKEDRKSTRLNSSH